MIPDGGTGLFKITKKFGSVCGYADKTPNEPSDIKSVSHRAFSVGSDKLSIGITD